VLRASSTFSRNAALSALATELALVKFSVAVAVFAMKMVVTI
jgi:hypothetical protein